MRLLFTSLLIAVALGGGAFLSSCALEVEHTTTRSGHHSHHRGHHNHHYWNDAGEAYGEAASIKNLTVLPIKLPSSFVGSVSERDEKRWREAWPANGAVLLASIIINSLDIHVTAVPGQEKPKTGHYLEFEILQYDLGDVAKSNQGGGTEGWSKMNAIGRIYNAETGKMVVDLAFDEQTERFNEIPAFDAQIGSIGQNLANWFREKQAGRK